MMASADYCACKVCGYKSFYDANMTFEPVRVGGVLEFLPVRCGDYAGLCVECAKTHKLVAVRRKKPVSVTIEEVS